MRFYEDEVSHALRFGDIVSGFVLATPKLEGPIDTGSSPSYGIEVVGPSLSVIMSPCCSIKDKIIALAPLKRINSNFYRNPYLEEDLTRINRPMKPQDSLPPIAWEKMEEENRQRRLAQGDAYAFLEIFIYQGHDLLPAYELSKSGKDRRSTNYYMIDFRETQKVHCDMVVNPSDSPLRAKLLELTIDCRSQLRDKVANYFSRVPEEDQV